MSFVYPLLSKCVLIKILKIYWYTANIIYNFMARKTDVGHAGKTVLYVRILLNQHLSKTTKVIPITFKAA
jgi:hypothetical protein